MDAHELAEKLRNTQPKTVETFEEVVKWCSDNASNLDLGDADQKYLYTMSTKYLMKIKIGRWNDNDAKMIIEFFAKSYAKEYGIDEKITIEILQMSEYKERFKDSSNAKCINMGDGNSCVVYSENVIDNLKSNETIRFLRGLQTVFHEVVHSRQYNDLYTKAKENDYDGDMYKMALETIVHRGYPQFYKENYTSQVREYKAEYLGLEEALKALKTKIMQDFTEEEKKDILNEWLQIDGKDKYGEGDSIKFAGKDENAIAFVDYATKQYIEARPDTINEMPILQRAYNEDGSKKDIIQLLQDRQALIDSGQANDKTDDLYETIANYRNYGKGELRGEVEALEKYVVTAGIDDEFVFQLIEQRLGRMNLTEQEIEKYMDITRKKVETTIEIIRLEAELKILEEEEQEIAPREEESIRDEVGDEFKPKTEGQEQEEVQVETMWQNRFQSWDRNSVNFPNSAKRKEEAVRVMQDIERERRKQDRDQQIKDSQQEQMQR